MNCASTERWRWLLPVAIVVALSACAPPARVAIERPDTPVPRSGYDDQSADTQRLQDDPFANPGYLWVDRGERLFADSSGDSRACAGCHGAGGEALRGAATRYPAVDTAAGGLVNLEQRINHCRTTRQGRPPLAYESDELLALTAFVANRSLGMPFAVDIDGPARAAFEAGRRYYYQRRGQLNLACHHCHVDNAGRRLRGDTISQGHGNGYPAYRLEWQSVGSLHRRLQFCNTGVRAEPFPAGDRRYVQLELYLAWRAGSLPLETPAVRR